MQPPTPTEAPLVHAKASVFCTDGSGRQALHSQLTSLHTDYSNDNSKTLEAQLIRMWRSAEIMTLTIEPLHFREVIGLEDITSIKPKTIEVV